MVRNLVYGLPLAAFLLLVGTTEIGYAINKSYAIALLSAGVATALLFSMAVARLTTGNAMTTEESIEAETPVGKIKILGGARSLLIFMFSAMAYFGYIHHVSTQQDIARVLIELASLREATAENTYVLSLSQAERENLRIAMPESLRRKIRSRE